MVGPVGSAVGSVGGTVGSLTVGLAGPDLITNAHVRSSQSPEQHVRRTWRRFAACDAGDDCRIHGGVPPANMDRVADAPSSLVGETPDDDHAPSANGKHVFNNE